MTRIERAAAVFGIALLVVTAVAATVAAVADVVSP